MMFIINWLWNNLAYVSLIVLFITSLPITANNSFFRQLREKWDIQLTQPSKNAIRVALAVIALGFGFGKQYQDDQKAQQNDSIIAAQHITLSHIDTNTQKANMLIDSFRDENNKLSLALSNRAMGIYNALLGSDITPTLSFFPANGMDYLMISNDDKENPVYELGVSIKQVDRVLQNCQHVNFIFDQNCLQPYTQEISENAIGKNGLVNGPVTINLGDRGILFCVVQTKGGGIFFHEMLYIRKNGLIYFKARVYRRLNGRKVFVRTYQTPRQYDELKVDFDKVFPQNVHLWQFTTLQPK